jgi:threonine dehydrogenase-like Zn-dependent dehydrogenase
MQKAVAAVSSGLIDPTPLYTDMLSLSDLNRGFELTNTRPDGFMKALIQL